MRGRGLACAAAAALVAGCLEAPPTSEASLPDGLIGWYPMDQGGDTGVAADAAGGGDGMCTAPRCPQPVAGHIEGAYQFDGFDDEMIVADRDSLHTASGTVAAWVHLTLGPAAVISKPYGVETANSWLLLVEGGGSVLIETSDGYVSSGAGTVDFARWTHMALTWSAAGSALFVDGAQVITGPPGTLFDVNPVVLGADRDYGMPVAPMTGLLDDVRIYDRLLVPAEIEALAAM